MEQQRPCTDSGMPARPARRRWFHSCMVRPMMLWPAARSMAATVEESTPPDMATAMVSVGMLLMNRLPRAGCGFSRGQHFRGENLATFDDIANAARVGEIGERVGTEDDEAGATA